MTMVRPGFMIDGAIVGLIAGIVGYRLWRLIGADTITAPIRDRLPSWLQEMVECPWCLGTWIAAATAVGLWGWFLPGYTLNGVMVACVIASVVTGMLGEHL